MNTFKIMQRQRRSIDTSRSVTFRQPVNSFAPSSTSTFQPTPLDIQTQLDRAARFGRSLTRFPVFDQSSMSPSPQGSKKSISAHPLQTAPLNRQLMLRAIAARSGSITAQYPSLAPSAQPLQRQEMDGRHMRPTQLLSKPPGGHTATKDEELALPWNRISPARINGEQLRQRIQAARGRGHPLNASAQHILERELRTDLSAVRVHSDEEADRLSRAVHARAFTSGTDIFFRRGMYRPGSSRGLHLLAHEMTHVVQQAAGPVTGTSSAGGVSISDPSDRFEQAAEASASRITTASSLQFEDAGGVSQQAPNRAGIAAPQELREGVPDIKTRQSSTTPLSIQRDVVIIDGHEVEVADEEEEQQAKDIIKKIKTDYGVSLSSQKTINAIKHTNQSGDENESAAAKKLRDKRMEDLEAETWTLTELKLVEKALSNFAPILGERRQKSPRSRKAQEVTTIGKVTQDVDTGAALGEYFPSHQNFTLYAEGQYQAKKSQAKLVELYETIIHELSHGLLEHRLGDFVKAVKYWKTAREPSNIEGVEPLPTPGSGWRGANEDMMDCVGLYFSKSSRPNFEKNFPERFAIIDRIVKEEFGPTEEEIEERNAKLKKATGGPARKVGGRRIKGPRNSRKRRLNKGTGRQ